MNIEVINLHETKCPVGYEFIGRPSIFGNLWVVGVHGKREDVIERWRQWVFGIVKEMMATGLESPANPQAGKPALRVSETELLRLEMEMIPGPQRKAVEVMAADPIRRAAVWAELNRLVEKGRAGAAPPLEADQQVSPTMLTLACYCKPLACHGDVLARCVEWLAEQGNAAAARQRPPYQAQNVQTGRAA